MTSHVWLTSPVRWARGWPVWGLHRRVLYYVVSVELIAFVAATYTGMLYPVNRADWNRVGILVVCAVVHIEATRRIDERQREIAAGSRPYLDLKSVWNFAALLLLPPALATGMVVFTYTYAWFRVWPQKQSVSLYRWIYSAATVVLATQVAIAVLVFGTPGYPSLPGGVRGIAVVAAVGAVRWLINYALVLLVLALSQPQLTSRELLAGFKDQIMEAGAVAFGACTAALLVFQPIYVVAPVVALLAMQRTVLVTQYERAAQIDAKTGLYNSSWWRKHADQVLARAQSTGTQVGILMADLDHFKQINDTYGHPAGDEVLIAVATAMSGQVRGDIDIVGRFGGEEFAILLPEVSEREMLDTAERIRLHVAAMGVVVQGDDGPVETIRVTVSIGAALFPRNGNDLGELTLRADSALYDAKKQGRNQVRLHSTSVPAGNS
jgi:diguanylate cyclase (GGDEF)-like protein